MNTNKTVLTFSLLQAGNPSGFQPEGERVKTVLTAVL